MSCVARWLGVFGILMAFMPHVAMSDVHTIRVAAHDSYPKFYILPFDSTASTPISGMGVDILEALEQTDPRLNIQLVPEMMPVKRMFEQLKSGDLDLFIGLTKTQERETFLTFTNQPLYPMRQVVVSRMDIPYAPRSLVEFEVLGKRGTLLTFLGAEAIRGYIKEQAPGVTVSLQARSVEQGLCLVADGFYNFFYFHELSIMTTKKNLDIAPELRVLPTVFRSTNHYAAISNQTDQATRQSLLMAFDALHHSGTLKDIYVSYAAKK